MIKNLLFDMGGVIFCQDTDEAFRRFRQAGVDPNYYLGEYGQKDFFLDVETGAIDAYEFCHKMALVAGRDSISFDEAQQCWLGFLVDVPVEPLLELNRLRNKYHVCLLSNTNPFIMDYMRSERFCTLNRPITDFFDTLFCSYEMRAYKPNPEIFLKALAADGMIAEECLFIDDSLKNVQAAQAVGIHGLHVAHNQDWRQPLAEAIAALTEPSDSHPQ